MVDDLAVAKVESIDFLHICIGKSEIPNVKILLDALFVNGLRDNDNAPLDVEAKRDLRRSLAILGSNLGEHRVGEDTVAALRERPPGFQDNTKFFCRFKGLLLVEERVAFHLVDHGHDLAVQAQVSHALGIEIAYSDCLCLSALINIFQRAPCGIVVANRLMQQIQVDILQTELVQGNLKALFSSGIILNPELRGDEQLFAGADAVGNGAADCCAIASSFAYAAAVSISR